MLGNVLLFIAIAVLIFTIYYAWWTKIRVVKLRQDIFDKRDELFDLAITVQASDDPAYQAARMHLNSMLDMVKYFSVQSVEYMIKVGHLSPTPHMTSKDPKLEAAIADTFEWLVRRIAKYLIHETFSGFLIYRIYGSEPALKKAVTEETQQKVRMILDSDVLTHWKSNTQVSAT